MLKIEHYITSNGRSPFDEWLSTLDVLTRTRIRVKIERVALGQTRDLKSVGDQVFEIKLNFGSGYRVYFGRVQGVMILLLLGGDKGTQKRDILKAKEYWREYAKMQKL